MRCAFAHTFTLTVTIPNPQCDVKLLSQVQKQKDFFFCRYCIKSNENPQSEDRGFHAQYILRSRARLILTKTCTPATLFPCLSRAGAKTPMPIRRGITPITPPPTPLLAGKPTVSANSPEPSYIPQIAIVALTYLAYSAGNSRSPVCGCTP